MASTDTLYVWEARAGLPPGELTAVPQFGLRRGFVHAAFDDAADEFLDFHGIAPSSFSLAGGLTVRLFWAATNESGLGLTVQWNVGFRLVDIGVNNIDDDHPYVPNTASGTEDSVSGRFTRTEITFVTGGDMDSVASGEVFVLRVSRDVSADTLVGDAELYSVEIEET